MATVRSRTQQGGTTRAPGRLVLAMLCTAQLMVVLDDAVLNIALPTAQPDLGFLTLPGTGALLLAAARAAGRQLLRRHPAGRKDLP